MYNLNLSNKARQKLTVALENNMFLDLYFEYKPNQLGWFFNFTYNDITYSNIRLTTSFNILRAYRNWLPFGLRCDTADSFEPMGIDDFVENYAKVYILTKSELEAIESLYYAKV